MDAVAKQGIAIINWNGKDITDEISAYLSSVTWISHEESSIDELSMVMENNEQKWTGDWLPTEGDVIELMIGYQNKLINAGLFQVDEITANGPPHVVEIKAISSFITNTLRTRNSKSFEAQTLKQLALYFCNQYGFKLIDDTSDLLSGITLTRKTQEQKTDLQFLSELAKEYGFLFSMKGNRMVFTSYYKLDNATAIMDISTHQVGNYTVTQKTYDTYSSGKIAKLDCKSGGVYNWDASGVLNTNASDSETFEGRVESVQQAQQKVKGGLWNKNKFKISGNLNDIPGDPSLIAGNNFNLKGLGKLSGKYHITTSTHKVSGSYTTSLEIRKTGDIPKPQQVPPENGEKAAYDSENFDFVDNENNSQEDFTTN